MRVALIVVAVCLAALAGPELVLLASSVVAGWAGPLVVGLFFNIFIIYGVTLELRTSA